MPHIESESLEGDGDKSTTFETTVVEKVLDLTYSPVEPIETLYFLLTY
jgi:hypothetical protein